MYQCSDLSLDQTYVVQVTQPTGSVGFTGDGVDTTKGTVGPFTLTTTEKIVNVGIVITATEVSGVGSVVGTVWLDSDNDGMKDDGEGGLVPCNVTLAAEDGTVAATTTTDNNGYYSFNIDAGVYKLVVVNPNASLYIFLSYEYSVYSQVDVNGAATVTVAPGNTTTIDAGLQAQGDRPNPCTSNDVNGCPY